MVLTTLRNRWISGTSSWLPTSCSRRFAKEVKMHAEPLMDEVALGPSAEERTASDFDAAVIRHTQVSKEYWHVVLKTPSDIAPAAPGQFYQLKCPQRGADYPY